MIELELQQSLFLYPVTKNILTTNTITDPAGKHAGSLHFLGVKIDTHRG